jgi:hypothetical protein
MNRALPLLLTVAIMWNGCLPAALGAGDARSDTAVAAGLAYLARQQGEDGAFSRDEQRLPDTAAALLAYLSAGYVPDVGRYGRTVRRAVEVLLAAPAPGGASAPRMRAQAMLALAMIEGFTVEPDAQQRQRLNAAIAAAVGALVAAQAPSGAWSSAAGQAADFSTTRWALLALSAARTIGIAVPEAAVRRAVAYLGGEQPPSLVAENAFFLTLAASTSADQRVRTTQRLLDRQQPDAAWPTDDATSTPIQATAFSLMTFTSRLHNLKTIRE